MHPDAVTEIAIRIYCAVKAHQAGIGAEYYRKQYFKDTIPHRGWIEIAQLAWNQHIADANAIGKALNAASGDEGGSVQ